MTAWMLHNEKENPLYAEFDYLIEILKEHEVTSPLAMVCGRVRVHDATDRAQIQELLINAELADKAHAEGVRQSSRDRGISRSTRSRQRRLAEAGYEPETVLHARSACHRYRARLR